jgi:DNA primase
VNEIVTQFGRAARASAVEGLRTSAPVRQAESNQANRQERQILEVMVQLPGSFTSSQLRKISAAGMADTSFQRIVDGVAQVVGQELPGDFHNNLLNQLPEELAPLVRELALAELPVGEKSDLERYSKGIVRGAIIQALSREKEDLLGALRRLDPTNQAEAIAAVQRQLVELEAERRQLM